MATKTPKGVCMYDGNCIRKNPNHFAEYSHPIQFPTTGHPKPVVIKATPPAATTLNPFAPSLADVTSNDNSTAARGVCLTSATLGAAAVAAECGAKRSRSEGSDATVLEDCAAPNHSQAPNHHTRATTAPIKTLGTLGTKMPLNLLSEATEGVTAAASRGVHAACSTSTPRRSGESEERGRRSAAGGVNNSSAFKKSLPPLLKEILSVSPSLSTFSVSVTASGDYPVRGLADVYHVELPESAMRAVLSVARAAVHGTQCSPLAALPAVQLVGPFEVLWKIIEREKAMDDAALAGNVVAPLNRSDFPSDDALWSHWRFRHDPIETLTFAVPRALFEVYTPQRVDSCVAHVSRHRHNGGTDTEVQQSVKGLPSGLVIFQTGQCESGLAAAAAVFGGPQPLMSDDANAAVDLLLPPLSTGQQRCVSLAFYRDEWKPMASAAVAGQPPLSSTSAAVKGQPYGPTRLQIVQSLAVLADAKTAAASPIPLAVAYRHPLTLLNSHAFRPLGSDVGRAVSYLIELLKKPLMVGLQRGSGPKASGSELRFLPFSFPPTVEPATLQAGLDLQTTLPPLTEKEIMVEVKNRKKFSFGATFGRLGVVVPYVKHTEMGYREPQTELDELEKILISLSTLASAGAFPAHHTPKCVGGSNAIYISENKITRSGNDSNNSRSLKKEQREALDEELRCIDIGNDECDFGYGLEVGCNFMYYAGGCRCNKCRAAHMANEAPHNNNNNNVGSEMFPKPSLNILQNEVVINELLWHAVNTLDTAFTLLDRPISRFALACHCRLLVAGCGRLEVAVIQKGL